MEQALLAQSLITATADEQHNLLTHFSALVDVHLAYTLKNLYDDLKSSDPARANAVVSTLQLLVDYIEDSRVLALADWVTGLAALENGQPEEAILYLDAAEGQFALSGDLHRAAQTQVTKMHALTALREYDRALHSGLLVRDFFTQIGDTAAAAKVEQDLSNIRLQAGISSH